MKLFKNFHKIFILLAIGYWMSSATASAGVIEDLKQQIGVKEEEVKKLEAQAENYKKGIQTTKSKEITLKNQISNIDSAITELKFNISLTQIKIDKQILEIQELDLEIEKNVEQISNLKEKIKNLIRTLEKEDKKDAISFILKNENLSSILNQIKSLDSLLNEIQYKLSDVKKFKIFLEEKLLLAENKKVSLEDLKINLDAQKKISDIQKLEKNTILKQTKNQEQAFQKLLLDTEKQRKEIQKDIVDLEEKLRFTIDPNTIPVFRAGLLSWPTGGILSQKYGPTSSTGFINDAYEFHNGIDIAASLGTPIKSAKEGFIKATGTNGNYAYGNWIAVDHENGLITLYAHLSLVSMKTGQKVNTGDIMGYMGSTGFSTGPHLHFTVYAANTFLVRDRWFGQLPLGGSLDPLKYL